IGSSDSFLIRREQTIAHNGDASQLQKAYQDQGIEEKKSQAFVKVNDLPANKGGNDEGETYEKKQHLVNSYAAWLTESQRIG
ncbi:MAG: hypothetical protein ACYSSO_15500, partial [Planctomycetota bacterium]